MNSNFQTGLRIGLSLVTLTSTFALAGCGSGSTTTTNTNTTAYTRSFNAYLPATGNVGSLLFASGTTALSGNNYIGYGSFTGTNSYTSVTSGTFTATATESGTANSLTFATMPTLTGDSSYYTLVAAGKAGQTGTFAPQLFALPSYRGDLTQILAATNQIRVVNLSTNPNPIALYATTDGVPTAAISTSFSSIPFGYSATNNPYTSVQTISLVRLAIVDTTSPTTPLTLSGGSNLNTQTLSTAVAYTLYVYGTPGSTTNPLTAQWVQDYPF